ncbi:MAG TPA: MoaD/ThiS family protein [Candidatus Hydrothermia bacterium]|nr:MoaD/ThiS family protein [Candidatus Hydrothermae bacterium]MDD3649763.1 MoaD/ThiS family protein [Candidatus Hydrothermia bacterium]MDD5573071.1 MoaD/ThiS family protein [Candidatus Hydrothermia bacterium]HOK23706.1 MoaD/ThiS family protein [Candidatus Hydrothermia bacterium]HOL24415.1 MoaD/ThiS family protein [Candidatus Hydrothermia bacterium]
MKVTLRVYTYLKAELGKGEICIEIPDSDSISLGRLLEEVQKSTGKDIKEKIIKDNKIRDGIILMLNGKNLLTFESGEVLFHDGDVISVLPPGSGG